jgi:AcrR family transcriptional regulator
MTEAKHSEALTGRQAAYVARNRAALIQAGQELLHEIGPSATIEQISAHAQVSPATIYKYFHNKDQFFVEALGAMWHEWVPWAFAQTSTKDHLEAVVTLCRRLFRVKETHPHFAQVLHNTFKEMPDFFLQADEETAKGVFARLATAGQIAGDDFENRFKLWSSMFLTLNASVHVTEDLSPVQADAALGIALSVWGVTPARVKKLISRDLGLALLK